MILRTRQTSIACLRCQMRPFGLLGGARNPPRAFARLPRTQSIAPPLRRSHWTEPKAQEEDYDAPDTPASTSEAPAETQDGERTAEPMLVRWVNEPVPTTRKKRAEIRSEADWARLRQLNRSNLREGSAPVTVDSLGKPTNIVVLREKDKNREVSYVTDKGDPIIIEHEPIDILALMQKDIGIAGAAEVLENIESLRPKEDEEDKRVLRWEEIEVLEKHLHDGFTTAQLLAYVEHNEARGIKQQQKDTEKEKKAGEEQIKIQAHDPLAVTATDNGIAAATELEAQSPILKQSKWMPGISEDGDKFEDSLLRGYTSEANTKKQIVTMLIIRSCWKVEAEELQSAIGEVEVQLNPADLELLISSRIDNPPLKRISDALIRTENEKIDVYRGRQVVRITGTQTQTAQIVAAIEQIISHMRTIRLDLKTLRGQDSDEHRSEVLRELEQLTNAEVTKISKDKIEVKGMNLHPGAGLSTMADVARRVLLSASDVANQTVKNVGFKMTDKPVYAVEYPLHDGMSWRNKMRHWSRWESPMDKPAEKVVDQNMFVMELSDLTGEKTAEVTEADELEVAAKPEDELVPAAEEEADAAVEAVEPGSQEMTATDTLWQTIPQTRATAVIGNVLHETEPGPTVGTNPVSHEMRNIHAARTLFAPTTRNLARLVDHLEPVAESTGARVVMRFIPSPWTAHGEKMLKAFPAVEMNFQRIKDLPLKLDGIYAIVDDVNNDIMIPDRTLDLSFRQKTHFTVNLENISFSPEIQEFLDKSHLNPSKEEILTPPEVTLPIAAHMCRKDSGLLLDAGTYMHVPYLFAGLEIRQQTLYDYNGWLLRYTAINGGKAAGVRSELALEYTRAPTEAASTLESSADDTLRDFTARGFQLVDELDTPRPVKSRAIGRGVAPEETYLPVEHVYLPSVRYCMVDKASPAPQTFKCFNHRPVLGPLNIAKRVEGLKMEHDASLEEATPLKSTRFDAAAKVLGYER